MQLQKIVIGSVIITNVYYVLDTMLNILHTAAQLIFKLIMYVRYYDFSHFTNEKIRDQRGLVIYPGSQNN